MKKTIFTVMVFLLAIGVAYADQDVRNSKHNLSTTAAATSVTRTFFLDSGTDQVCVFCHTPHFAASSPKDMPLWNRYRSGNAPTYTLYSSATMDTTPGQPTGVSAACLSCHDGTVAFDSLVNYPGSGLGTSGTPPTSWSWNSTNIINGSASAYIGTDLGNDHPISMTYPTTTQDPAFYAPASGKVGGKLPLYGSGTDQVECGSCHDPHQSGVTGNPTFLRMSNSGSALCLTCHKK